MSEPRSGLRIGTIHFRLLCRIHQLHEIFRDFRRGIIFVSCNDLFRKRGFQRTRSSSMRLMPIKPHRLRVAEFTYPEVRKLATKTALLHTAEGDTRIGGAAVSYTHLTLPTKA